ncbi:MAG: GNAT family N-acetyltransferase [Clostridiales bacterium]|nr:GNAT family N-acetyltransferase [Bacillota bacterium]MEE0516274.1 GNAT family N-acetyltransferase [Anaerovoracaceae bacterium]PWL93847.1 MAG: GNAT family N-acetyltransferase [Clostridiales bacterium]
MYTLEKATDNDIPLCYRIVDDGRKFQQAQGFVQWTAEYPNIDTVSEDIMSQKGYVIKKGSKIAAYMCIDFSGEPAYDSIEGHWHTDSKYAVIHRLSVKSDFRNSGLSDTIFRLAEEFCLKNDITCIRLDTGFENKRMQHIIEKHGFTHCGTVFFQGGCRIAYDKLLSHGQNG